VERLLLRPRETAPIIAARTSPLYASVVAQALERVRAGSTERPLALWRPLALRQSELSMGTEQTENVLAAEVVRVTAEQTASLRDALAGADDARAVAEARALLQWGRSAARFVSAMRPGAVRDESDIVGLCRTYVYRGDDTERDGARDVFERLSEAAMRLGGSAAGAAAAATAPDAAAAAAESSSSPSSSSSSSASEESSEEAGADAGAQGSEGALSEQELAQLAELVGLPADPGAAERVARGAKQLREAFDHACTRREDSLFTVRMCVCVNVRACV
jgi:hypothetical protein